MADPRVRAILTDVEGTTTSVAFVKNELFSYARRELGAFVQAHRSDPVVVRALEETAQLEGAPLNDSDAIRVLLRWIDEDRKATPLKTLQGLVWAQAYESGAVKGHFYADAVDVMRLWHARGIPIYVYSSGSVAAQRLIFGYSIYGDLTPMMAGYFDTTIGAKIETASYGAIADEIGVAPGDVLFLSDSEAEIAAAGAAAMHVARIVRPEDGTTGAGFSTFREVDEALNVALKAL